MSQCSYHPVPRMAALSAAIVMVLASTNALGQDATETPEREAATLDRVQVTGSRIKRVDLETASPVLALGREEIQSTGLQTVGEVLRTITVSDNGGLTNVTSSTNANDGSQTASLRNLGVARTLVLVNGRRWVDGGGAVDLTTIPTAMIERIEVLKDGASAIYGSDAIAGVINIILRSDFQGASASAYVGQNSHGDGALKSYDFTLGTSFERGNLVMTASHLDQERIGAGDREIASTPIFGCADPIGSSDCGSIFPQRGYFVTSSGALTLRPDREIEGLAPGERTPDDFRPFTNADRYNFAPINDLMTPSKRTTFYTQGVFNLTDSINFNGALYYGKRKSVTSIAETPLTIGGPAFGAGPQWIFPISADNVYNPFGEQLDIVGFRTSAVGPRRTFQNYDNYGFVGGFDGAFQLAGRLFDWEATYQHFESAQTETGTGIINLFNLISGLGPSFIDVQGNAVCGTPDAPIAGCVPINLFNGQAGLTRDQIDYMSYTTVQELTTERDNYLLNLSGELFELPGGMASFAVGYEYRKDTITNIPDALVFAGGSSTPFQEPTKGSITIDELYLELSFPLLSGVPFADRLDFSVAARYSDYSGSGLIGSEVVRPDIGDTTNMKFGFTWKPFEDLMLRGNWAETFRAPGVFLLYGGGGEGFPQTTDPCNDTSAGYRSLSSEGQARCLAEGVPAGGVEQLNSQLRGLFGGSPDLQPEFGETRTLGLVYSPSWAEGLNLALDWWQIELKNGIAEVDVPTVLDRCYRENNQAACDLVERAGDGQMSTVRAGFENLEILRVEGYDFGASYAFDTTYGRIEAVLDASYTAEYTTGAQGDPEEPQNEVGQLIGTSGSRWRKRGTLGVNWTHGDWGAHYTMRHYSSLQEDCNNYVDGFAGGVFDRQVCSDPDRQTADGAAARNKIPSTTYHDAQVSFNTPYNSSIRLGVRNLFDKDPPIALNSFQNSFLQSYDIPGRFYYLSYTQNF